MLKYLFDYKKCTIMLVQYKKIPYAKNVPLYWYT